MIAGMESVAITEHGQGLKKSGDIIKDGVDIVFIHALPEPLLSLACEADIYSRSFLIAAMPASITSLWALIIITDIHTRTEAASLPCYYHCC